MRRFVASVLAGTAAVLMVPAPASAARPHPRPHVHLHRRPHPHRKPWPVTVTVQTVPALPGVRLALDGRTLVTGASGRATYTAEHNFARHTLTLLDTAVDQPTRRYRFTRWAGQRDPNQAFRTSVTGLPMRANYTVTAAFTVQYPVTAHLLDQHGAPLDLSRVSAVTVKSDTGRILPLPTTGAVWLDGITPEYRRSALVESTVYYSVQALTMSGTNIVDAGKQRFTPAQGQRVTVTGQLHDLTITARDALFRDPLGATAAVTGPDGVVTAVPFDATHTAHLTNLPRGPYHVTVRGARGVVLDEQFTLSRDKALRVAVLSTSDLSTLGTAGLLVAAALLLAGRGWARRVLLRVSRKARPA
ncbi:MAG TPA: hypothetical protein VJT31_32145 [Rugosimonospora sp.]|nr:hypothetical protein [Rugosimonospora sp.]